MEPAEFGRFSDPAVLILASLAGGEKHGYAMMEDIQATSGVHLGPGTLYGAISRLEADGMIEALPAVERRRPYRVTSKGISFLRAYLASLQQLVSLGYARLDV